MITVSNLHKKIGDTKILDGVSFEVSSASIFGLVGINGAGKSTLLRLIAGIYEPDSGSCLVDGQNTFTNDSARRDILYVGDEFYYPFGATVSTLRDFYASFYSLDQQRYQRYLSMFQLPLNKSVANFSKGMKRQLSLLLALSIRPKVMLLDEAFDGLDPLIRLYVKKELAEILEEGSSVIISSHNLKELEDICDSFGLLEDGEISNYGDLLESKEHLNKYQIAFHEEKTPEDFADFNLVHFKKEGQVYTLAIRGEREKVLAQLQAMNPLLCNIVPINFEELFIYEVESRGKNDE